MVTNYLKIYIYFNFNNNNYINIPRNATWQFAIAGWSHRWICCPKCCPVGHCISTATPRSHLKNLVQSVGCGNRVGLNGSSLGSQKSGFCVVVSGANVGGAVGKIVVESVPGDSVAVGGADGKRVVGSVAGDSVTVGGAGGKRVVGSVTGASVIVGGADGKRVVGSVSGASVIVGGAVGNSVVSGEIVVGSVVIDTQFPVGQSHSYKKKKPITTAIFIIS